MNNHNRKVIVTFKHEQRLNPTTGDLEFYKRPDFETTEANLNDFKRLHGKHIKEIKLADSGEKIKTTNEKVVEKIVEKVVVKEVKAETTDIDLILALDKKGKSANSIARTLEIKIDEVEKILSDYKQVA